MSITSPARGPRAAALLLACALLAAACGSGDGTSGEDGASGDGDATQQEQGFSVAVASYDLAVSSGERRFTVGLQAPDNRLVTHGTVAMEFAYLGDGEQQVESPETSITTTAEFLPIPGTPAVAGTGDASPRLSAPSEASGVYGAPVTFDQVGFWTVRVTADIQGEGSQQGNASFEVAEQAQIPDVGSDALLTENLTVDDVGTNGVTATAVDSRAQDDAPVPDTELHDSTIADGIAAGRPVVALFATPVYCVSQFCGPITDMVAGLAPQHPEADFVHVEVWNDHESQAVNQAAADWLLRDDNLQEPWLFVIGADGVITHRFDNVATQGELEAALAELA